MTRSAQSATIAIPSVRRSYPLYSRGVKMRELRDSSVETRSEANEERSERLRIFTTRRGATARQASRPPQSGARRRSRADCDEAERRVIPSPNESRRTQTRSVKLSVTSVSPPHPPYEERIGTQGDGVELLASVNVQARTILFAPEHFCPVPVVPEFFRPPSFRSFARRAA